MRLLLSQYFFHRHFPSTSVFVYAAGTVFMYYIVWLFRHTYAGGFCTDYKFYNTNLQFTNRTTETPYDNYLRSCDRHQVMKTCDDTLLVYMSK